MGENKRKKSRIKSVIAEIAHDLKIDKKLVRQVLLLAFKEIALILILKGKPVMIRRFVKFVVAAKGIIKIKQDLNKLETRKK